MLTYTPTRQHPDEDDVDFIHNFYERRVLQEISHTSERALTDREFLADVACVALNRLPPRYIRHDVDMTFFMSPQEMQEIEEKVTRAVAAALSYVVSRERSASANDRTDAAAVKSQTPAEKNLSKKIPAKKSQK